LLLKAIQAFVTSSQQELCHAASMCNLGTSVQVEWKKFAELRQDVDAQWRALPKAADVLSQPLKDKVKTVTAHLRAHQDA